MNQKIYHIPKNNKENVEKIKKEENEDKKKFERNYK